MRLYPVYTTSQINGINKPSSNLIDRYALTPQTPRTPLHQTREPGQRRDGSSRRPAKSPPSQSPHPWLIFATKAYIRNIAAPKGTSTTMTCTVPMKASRRAPLSPAESIAAMSAYL